MTAPGSNAAQRSASLGSGLAGPTPIVGIKNADCQVDIKVKQKDRQCQATQGSGDFQCQVELLTDKEEPATGDFECQVKLSPEKPAIIVEAPKPEAPLKEFADAPCQAGVEQEDAEI